MSLCQLLNQIEKEDNVFLFLPNLIGYARVVLALLACLTMLYFPIITLFLYFLSAFLDAFDGYAARAFNQSTRFGALLDQLTDRCGTLCLIFVLGHLYPSHMFLFQLSAVIDIAGHWMFTQVALMTGKSSHKKIDLSESAILRIYYTSKPVLFAMCFANELFYVALYMLYFYEGPFGLFRSLVWLSAPFAIIKTAITVVHLWAACMNVKELDMAERRAAEITAKAADKDN